MTREEKREVLNMESTAYYSGFGGIEIKSIKYGIEDYVLFVAGAWCSAASVHRARIRYNAAGDPYFIYKGYRIPFCECLRM